MSIDRGKLKTGEGKFHSLNAYNDADNVPLLFIKWAFSEEIIERSKRAEFAWNPSGLVAVA